MGQVQCIMQIGPNLFDWIGFGSHRPNQVHFLSFGHKKGHHHGSADFSVLSRNHRTDYTKSMQIKQTSK